MVALVTGSAARGVGSAVARRLAAGGAKVVVSGIQEDRARAVAEAIARDYPDTLVVGHAIDVGDPDAIEVAVNRVLHEIGPIRVLVNNAAVNSVSSILDCDPETWDWLVRVNLSGPWHMCRNVMPHMRDHGGGVIVNISSTAADIGGSGVSAAYAVTKGGLNVLTRACAHEGGPHGIRAVTVALGVVRGTKFIDDHPEVLTLPNLVGRLAEAPDTLSVAEAIAFLASDRARHITGEIINIASGSYMRS